MLEEPTIGLEGCGFQRDAISPTSMEQTGLEAEFHQMARDLINPVYAMKPQQKFWMPVLSGAFCLVYTLM